MRIRCAHNLERSFSKFSDPQKSGWGSAPSPGFAVLPFVLVGQARKAVANKKAAEAAAPVRPHTGYVGRDTILMCSLISNNLAFTHECAEKDSRHAIALARVFVRTAARLHCALGTSTTHTHTHTHTQTVTDGSLCRVGSLCCGLPPGSMLRAQAAPKPLPVPAYAAPPQMASPAKQQAVRPITEQ